jgi:hypothetical protein
VNTGPARIEPAHLHEGNVPGLRWVRNVRKSEPGFGSRLPTAIRFHVGDQDIADAIVRFKISLPQEAEGLVRDGDIKEALKEAHYYTIAKNIRRESRLRLGKQSAEEITPIEALKAYLEAQKLSKGYSELLLKYGEELIRENLEGEKGAYPEATAHF